MTSHGEKLGLGIALLALSFADGASAEEAMTGAYGAAPQVAAQPPKQVLFRADMSLVPAYGYQWAQGRGSDGSDYNFDTSEFLLGGRLGLNLGYAPSPSIRWGLRGTAMLASTLAGGQGLRYTSLDGALMYTIGPTLGLRKLSSLPLELQLEAAFATLMPLGMQAAIGAPDNIYALGGSQYGVLVGGQAIWRPGGWSSPWGLSGGVHGTFTSAGASAQGLTAAAEFGFVVGY